MVAGNDGAVYFSERRLEKGEVRRDEEDSDFIGNGDGGRVSVTVLCGDFGYHQPFGDSDNECLGEYRADGVQLHVSCSG